MYHRYRWLVLLLYLGLLPVVIHGASRAWQSGGNRLEDWLPPSFEATRKLKWFFQRFGSDEYLMVGWPGGTMEDPRVGRMAEAMRQVPPPTPATQATPDTSAERMPSGPYFRSVLTGPSVLEQLQAPPLNLSPGQARDRLRGWLLGPDGRSTAIVARLADRGLANREGAVAFVEQCAERTSGLEVSELRMAGPTVDGVAIDRLTERVLPGYTILSALACCVVTFLCLRGIRVTLMVLATAIYSQQLAMAILYFTGGTVDAIMLMMASLVFVLSVSSSVHLVNYYRDAVAREGVAGACDRAVADAFAPCGLAALTTAVGLASLAISQILPITRFGVYAAIGVLGGLGVLLTLLPSALSIWPDRKTDPGRTISGALARSRRRAGRLRPSWSRLTRLVERRRMAIVTAGLVTLILLGLGVPRIQTTVRIHDLFADDVELLREYAWLEARIGPLVPVEAIVHFPRVDRGDADDAADNDDAGRRMLRQLIVVEHIRQALSGIDQIGASMSAATFAPPLPDWSEGGVRQSLRRAVFENKLERAAPRIINAGYLVKDDRQWLWRISLRVPAERDIDHAALLQTIHARAAPILTAAAGQAPSPTLDVVGGVPLVHQAQKQLLRDLMQSFLLAFALIGVVLMILLRSPTAGALTMIPNLLPSMAIFGLMGWGGWDVGIGSVMTASVALGIAVDDTLHYVVWFRRGREQESSQRLLASSGQRRAVRYAYRRCAVAMVQTSLICGLGLLPMVFCPFLPAAQFAWLMLALLAAALLGDLVLLPAMLIGRLGRFFKTTASGRRGPDSAGSCPESATI